MTDAPDRPFTVDTARIAATEGRLAEWVSEFLASPGSDNEVLAEVLPETLACWTGPVELPLDQLQRLAGPADAPVLVPVDDDYWDGRVDDMAARIAEGWEPAPVVVTYKDGGDLEVEDGNHRIESLRRAGRERAWAVVGFADPADRARFEETHPPAP
jgi:hypothetical protein